MPVSTDALDEDVRELKAELRGLREEMHAGFKEMRTGFEKANERMDTLFAKANERMDTLFANTNERMDTLFAKTNERMDILFAKTNERMDILFAKTNERMDTGLARVDADIKALAVEQAGFKEGTKFFKWFGAAIITTFLTVGLGAIVTSSYWGGALSYQVKYLTDRVEGKPVSTPTPKP